MDREIFLQTSHTVYCQTGPIAIPPLPSTSELPSVRFTLDGDGQREHFRRECEPAFNCLIKTA